MVVNLNPKLLGSWKEKLLKLTVKGKIAISSFKFVFVSLKLLGYLVVGNLYIPSLRPGIYNLTVISGAKKRISVAMTTDTQWAWLPWHLENGENEFLHLKIICFCLFNIFHSNFILYNYSNIVQ